MPTSLHERLCLSHPAISSMNIESGCMSFGVLHSSVFEDYRYALHNSVSVNKEPHKQWWSHRIISLGVWFQT